MDRTTFLESMKEIGYSPTLFKREGDDCIYYSCSLYVSGLSFVTEGELPSNPEEDHTSLLVGSANMLFYQIGHALWHGNA